MKMIVGYGKAAQPAIPQLRELIVVLNEQVKNKEFPGGDINQQRVGAVENAIKAIEAATMQPELHSITPNKTLPRTL